MEQSKYVINKMAHIRKEKNLTLRDLAERLGSSPSNLQKLEAKNVKYLDMNIVFLFCQKLNVSISELLPPEEKKEELMNLDEFVHAGENLKNKIIRNNEKYDQSTVLLDDIEKFCNGGIKQFYKPHNFSNPDIYVERDAKNALKIRFGFRPARHQRRAAIGPRALLIVAPEGIILWADTKDWQLSDIRNDQFNGEEIDLNDWQKDIRTRLVEFITKAEENYIRLNN